MNPESIDIRSIVAEFQDQMTMFNQKVTEMIREEVCAIRFKSPSYIANPSNPGSSPSSGMFNPTGEEAVQPPDLSHHSLKVTTTIGTCFSPSF